MKRILALVLALLLVSMCSYALSSPSYDSDGNQYFISTSDDDVTSYLVFPNALPYAFRYADKEITILRYDFYQAKVGHGYYPFLHVQLDVSQLTDDEIYWLRSEDMRAYADCTINIEYDGFVDLSPILDLLWTDKKQIHTVYYNNTVSRTPFDGYQIFYMMWIEHPNGTTILFDSDDITINETKLGLLTESVTPLDLSEMDASILEQLKSKLAEEGISIE